MLQPRHSLVVTLVSCLLVAVGPTASRAETRDSFESPRPTWKLHERDCEVTMLQHRRAAGVAHSGQSSEHLRLLCGPGTKVYVTLAIQPTRVIAELKPSLWVRSTRPGILLMARVVLPRTPDPRGEGALTTLVHGTAYRQVGTWQQLQVGDILQQLHRQKGWELHDRFGRGVDVREAYVDLLVMNIYGGPGRSDVWIDDLAIEQQVTIKDIGGQLSPVPGDGQPNSSTQPADPSASVERMDVRANGSLLQVDRQRIFVTAIEHNGEPLTWLRTLGVNTVLLRAPPSIDLVAEARQAKLWLIAPPPHDWQDLQTSTRYRQVIAWNLGEPMSRAEIGATRELAQSLRQLGGVRPLPLMVGLHQPASDVGQFADILVSDADALAADQGIGPKKYRPVGRHPRFTTSQVMLANLPIDATDSSNATGDWSIEDRMRRQVYQTLAAGARGIILRSTSRLDGEGTQADQTRAMLLRVVAEIKSLQPWGAGGVPLGVISTSDPEVQVAVLQTERSRLLLAVRNGPPKQHGHAVRRVFFEDLGAINTMMVFQYSPKAGLRHLQHRRKSRCLHLSLDDVEPVAACIMTQDPLVIRHFGQQRLNERQRGEAFSSGRACGVSRTVLRDVGRSSR